MLAVRILELALAGSKRLILVRFRSPAFENGAVEVFHDLVDDSDKPLIASLQSLYRTR